MQLLRTALTTSALSMVASGALAELSADAVWDDIYALFSTAAEVTVGSESRSGNTLTVEDVVVTQTVAVDGSTNSSVTTLPRLELVEQDDGSVRVVLPSTISLSSRSTDGDVDVEIDMTIEQTGTEVVAFGEDRVERYDFTSDSMTLRAEDMSGDGADGEMPVMDMTVDASDISGSYTMGGTDDLREIRSNSSVGRVAFDMSGSAMAEGGDRPETFSITGQVVDIQSTGAVTMPGDMDAANLNASLEAGFRVIGDISYQQGGYTVSGDGADGAFQMVTSGDDGTLAFMMGADGLVYGAKSSGARIEVSGDQFPFPGPIAISMGENGGEFRMPVMPSDTAQPFGLELRMIDLVLPDMLYMMFDPSGMLPRDPASVVVDLQGTALLKSPILDPAAMMETETLEGELRTVDINEIRLSLLGAELTGDGAFTFTTGPDGIPVPAGVANLMLKGGNALLDTLVAMGLVPQEQAMGARMMIGMFAQPGEGDDTLVTTIEMTEDGQVLANGQRIR